MPISRRNFIGKTAGLGALAAVLQAQGATLCAPNDRSGIHPLCVPLAKRSDDSTVALMISPVQGDNTVQVVAVAPDGFSLSLLAKTTRDYVHKAIVEEEASDGESTKVAEAAGAIGASLHESGAFHTLGKDLPVYLTLRVGKFPDVMEQLVQRHLDKGDEQSALITCDLYKGTFEGWGRRGDVASDGSLDGSVIATGLRSAALGASSSAEGNYSLAAGEATLSSGEASMALGKGVAATGDGAAALGVYTPTEHCQYLAAHRATLERQVPACKCLQLQPRSRISCARACSSRRSARRPSTPACPRRISWLSPRAPPASSPPSPPC